MSGTALLSSAVDLAGAKQLLPERERRLTLVLQF